MVDRRPYGWALAVLFASAVGLLISAAVVESGVLGWLGIVAAGLATGFMIACDPGV
jgi:hypothetical protein